MRRRYAAKAGLFGGGSKAVTLTDLDRFLDFLVDEAAGDDDSIRTLYSSVAWVFWAINQRAGNIAQIPYLILPLEDEEDDPENEVDFGIDLRLTFWQVEAWLKLNGAAYVLQRMAGATLDKLQTLNGYSMRVKEYDNDGPTLFEQRVGNQVQTFTPEELLYFRTWSPVDDINEGVSSGQVGKTSASLVHNTNEWGQAFFRNGAIPAVLLTTDGIVPDAERDRIRGVWNQMLRGARNAFQTLILNKGLTPTVISQPVKDLAMPELEEIQRRQILASYGIPPGMGDITNYAERKEIEYTFWTKYIIPDVETYIEPVFNEQLFNPMGLRLSFQYNQIEAIQREEIAKAESASFFVSGVMLPMYKENTVAIDEVRRVADALLQQAGLPPLDEQFTPEERTPPALAPFAGEEPAGDESAPGSFTPIEERIESRVSKAERAPPKATAPQWGRLMVSLQNSAGGETKQSSAAK
jgi:HK97 family phage portal protein